jgi:hypothetical protein
MVRLEGLGKLKKKNAINSSQLELATFWLVAYRLNRNPSKNINKKSVNLSKAYTQLVQNCDIILFEIYHLHTHTHTHTHTHILLK